MPELLAELESATCDPIRSPYLLFRTNPGLEDIVAAEFRQHLSSQRQPDVDIDLRPFGFGGHTLVRVGQMMTADDLWTIACRMRSVHHVMRPLYSLRFDPTAAAPLAPIAATLRERGVPDMESAGKFRVTSRRSGDHSFSRLDIQREAGTALVARYGTVVDLVDFDLNVRVDIYGDVCIVGIQLTKEALSSRFARLYNPRATLRSNVAYALLHLARVGEHDSHASRRVLLDPFCGSGTILCEAAQLFPDLEIVGSDLSQEAVSGARRNMRAAALDERVQISCGDALEMSTTYADRRIGTIVTNPPYGVRLSRNLYFFDFYRKFLEQCALLLKPGERLVFIAWKRGVIDRANERLRQFNRIHVRIVETGGIYPRIYVMERR